MCGIVAAVAHHNVVPVLIDGLKRLEYRGYDSCGVALLGEHGLERARTVSRVQALQEELDQHHQTGEVGIAHTRWATHGVPAVRNAHPHISGGIAVVHNGIIENYQSLKAHLQAKGVVFESDTDTEVIAHLIGEAFHGDLLAAVQRTVLQLKGSYAIAVMKQGEPHHIVVARQGSPLVVGVGDKAMYAASDAIAISQATDQIIYLEEGDVVSLTPDSYQVYHRVDDEFFAVQRPPVTVSAQWGNVELGPYRHFMQKEIFEQPRVIADTLEGVHAIVPSLFGDEAETVFKKTQRLLFLACGTSYYAALTAKYWIEAIAKLPCDVEIASEYRYRDSVACPNTLVVTISQSGETADTLAALNHAQTTMGIEHSLTICNVPTSAMVRESQLHYITRAGVEISVASTKAFTTQLTALYVLALTLAKAHGRLTSEQEQQALTQLRHLPTVMQAVLAQEPQIVALSEIFASKEDALFLGRGIHYPIALEGALKLKEISYIHAEAYPAGELKHGPLALVDRNMPVVTVAPNDRLLEKLTSNMQEVRARGGELFIFADADSNVDMMPGMHIIRLPENMGMLSPILHAVPLQLLAYHTAIARGTDVDKPRNLAKSVTVE